jgi:putative membrane protein
MFVVAWFYFWITTRDETNWWIENLLILIFVPWFVFLQRKIHFSDTSLICIFLFLFFHIYGAQMSYTHNTAGEWIQNKFQLQRNPYDRFVHFSFGLFMVYPIHEYLIKRIKMKPSWAYYFAVEAILGLATIFELIEWGVAATTDSETGETYVATQGDVWDAHKDIALALLAATLVMMVVGMIRKVKSNN